MHQMLRLTPFTAAPLSYTTSDRMGNEDRKGGHGKGNWGKEGEAPAADGETKSWKEAEAEQGAEPEEPEPDTKSLEEYEAERVAAKKAMDEKLASLGGGAVREVEASFDGAKCEAKKNSDGEVMYQVKRDSRLHIVSAR